VYKPSPFRGYEEAYHPDEDPDYTINGLGELPTALADLDIVT
jgi:hypothetical protein